jgi:hypothetical protein
MNFVLRILKLHFPDSLKKRMLTELFDLTAQAFGVACPEIKSMSYRKMLEAYAVFTAGEAGRLSPNSPEWRAAKERLYENARSLGTKLRKTLRLRDPRDILEMSRILYQMLGIDFIGLSDGEVVIRRCFFSRFYTAAVCRVISSLDEGVAAGLSGGGRLEFSGRITEGLDCCRGRFIFKGIGK